MEFLRQSPFKVSTIESDPRAFGRRVGDVRDCASALYNRRNVLISGPRGIGKSSLGSQLQTAYLGTSTLLDRCEIGTRLPRYLCAFTACDDTTTLPALCSEILFSIERQCLALKSFRLSPARVSFEVDLKLVKAKLETDIAIRRPASVASDLVAGLSTIATSIAAIGFDGLNVMIDEVDLVPTSVNLGHFFKIVHETLGRDNLLDITFILAGQQGIYSRLVAEDASVERLVRHVPITVLEPDEARYVLEFAADNAKQPFAIDLRAADMILALSAGYPYSVHLIGDAAFNAMVDSKLMTTKEVLLGMGHLLRSDKREKYLERLRALSVDQRLLVLSMSRFSSKTIPMQIPVAWIARNLLAPPTTGTACDSILDSLVGEGHVVLNGEASSCQFTDEMFRIFTSLLVIDQRELQERRDLKAAYQSEKAETQPDRTAERRFLQDYGIIDPQGIDEAVEVLSSSAFEADWDREDHSRLTKFPR